MGRADRETRPAAIDEIEIDEFLQCALERCSGVVASLVGAKPIAIAEMCKRIGRKEAANAAGDRRPEREPLVKTQKGAAKIPDRIQLHALPEIAQCCKPQLGRIAGNQARCNGADRGADDPVRLDACFM